MHVRHTTATAAAAAVAHTHTHTNIHRCIAIHTRRHTYAHIHAIEQPKLLKGVLHGGLCKTVCPSGLRGWTQVPLARAAWAQIPQLSFMVSQMCICRNRVVLQRGIRGCKRLHVGSIVGRLHL